MHSWNHEHKTEARFEVTTISTTEDLGVHGVGPSLVFLIVLGVTTMHPSISVVSKSHTEGRGIVVTFFFATRDKQSCEVWAGRNGL